MLSRRALFLLTASALVLAACSDDDDDATEVNVTVPVRIVNASSGTAGTVDVSAGGASLTTGLAFRASTATCVQVPVNTTALVFSSGGTAIATAVTSFTAGNKYTAILVGTGANRSVVLLTDNAPAPSTGNAAVRFVDATAIAGDVHGTPAATAALSAATMLTGGANVGIGANTAYITTALTNTRFRLSAVNTPGTVRSDTGTTPVTFPTGSVTGFVFTEAGTPAGPTFIQVNPCP